MICAQFAWVACVFFILVGARFVPFSAAFTTYYREFNVYLYGAIKARVSKFEFSKMALSRS